MRRNGKRMRMQQWTVKLNDDEGEEKLVQATFKSVEDAKSVLGKQPWVFNGGLLILEKWPLSGNWGDAWLDKVLCWVKVKGLPIKLFTKKNVTRLGEMAGEVVEICWGDENRMFSNGYVRMRIGFLLNTSIFMGRFIPCGGKKHWIHFKFEHLPMLCFNRGIWGHEQKDCAGGMRRETDDAGNLVPKYGSWLKDDDPCPNGFVSAGIVNSTSPIDNGRHWGQERSSGNEGVVHGGPANHGGECTAEGGEQTVIRGVEEGVTKILEGAVNEQMDIMGHTLHVEPKEVKATTVGPSLKASIGPEIKGPECGIGPTMSNTHPCMDPTVASGSVHSTLPVVAIAKHDKKKGKNGEAAVAIDSEEIQRLRSKGKQVQQASVGVDGNENFAIGVSTGETRGPASTSGQRKRVSIKTRARLAKSNGNSRGHSKSVLEESKAQVGVPGGVFSVAESHTGGNHGGLGLGEKEVQLLVPEAQRLSATLQFGENFWSIDRVGLSGGLLLMWKEEVTVRVDSSSPCHIHAMIAGKDFLPWALTCFYGNPDASQRKFSWELLRNIRREVHGAWLCIGDFNEIVSLAEKVGGRINSAGAMEEFREVTDDCRLIDFSSSKTDLT
ncbi:hypothetical protein F8388_022041 [Cannabis sativa]|uniref:Zinc knuckle CX2CX4HX4C domain-containing protein n=1 Tax=Cannabis sativa TaxID=3483 RepID=A0A7J6G7P9_CANSA|nr:hypothetical protein F8388_022041 [Cannabis sativa]